MSIFSLPKTFQNDSDGRTSAYARYSFYETGTYNPKAIYSDYALTKTTDNPVYADGAGRFPVFYATEREEYRVVYEERIREGLYKTVWEQDGVVYGAAPANGVVEYTGNSENVPYHFSYQNLSGSVANFTDDVLSVTTPTAGFEVQPNGERFFLGYGGTGRVIQSFVLSNLLDLSSYSLEYAEAIDGGTVNVGCFTFNDDGTKFYIIDNLGDLYIQYALTTAYDLRTATREKTFTTTGQFLAGGVDIIWSNSGSAFYVCNVNDQEILYYLASTPYDIATLTYIGAYDLTSGVAQENSINSIQVTPDGKKAYFYGSSSERVYSLHMETPFNITTAVPGRQFLNLTSQIGVYGRFRFLDSGKRLWFVDEQWYRIYDYLTNFERPA